MVEILLTLAQLAPSLVTTHFTDGKLTRIDVTTKSNKQAVWHHSEPDRFNTSIINQVMEMYIKEYLAHSKYIVSAHAGTPEAVHLEWVEATGPRMAGAAKRQGVHPEERQKRHAQEFAADPFFS